MALSFLQEKSEALSRASDLTSRAVPLITDPDNVFALQHYNRAVTSLLARLSGRVDASEEEITLLTCILFICIEFLQSRIQPALAHLRQGLNVLCCSETGEYRKPQQRGWSSPNSDIIKDHVVPIFSRLSILPVMFGSPPPTSVQETIIQDASFLTTFEIPSTFSTLFDARSSLIHLMGLGLRFIRSADLTNFDDISNVAFLDALAVHQINLQVGLVNWYMAFLPLVQTNPIGVGCH
jgi:hypothetical protein